MGTISPRKRKNGSTAYTARVRIMRDGRTYQEAQTFDLKSAASAWMKRREGELARPGAIERIHGDDPPLSVVIDRYTDESEKEIGRTKAQVLKAIKNHDIANKPCSTITSTDIVAFAQALSTAPQTRGNYLSHLGAVFAIARPMWGYPLDETAMKDAFKVTRRMGITGKSRQRDRRPTLDELDKLMEHFIERKMRRPSSLPMHRVIAFAIFSTRRQEEITRIAWADYEKTHKRVLVRDMKNPGEKIGNDTWCDLPDQAVEIIEAMPRVADVIFPFSTDAIGAAFTRAVALLGIEDLHFHDLRHDGVSRLFETGLNIPHVAAVSGHRSWTSLKRYTHLRHVGDKYAGWKWLPAVTQA